MASMFGQLFRVATWGESHGHSIGVVVDGCPPRLPITVEEIQAELGRRRPGQSRLTSHRNEADEVEILSGVEDGLTLGSPIAMMVRNSDARPGDYEEMHRTFRPSHADYTYQAKYGIRAVEGGGRASARETIGRVAAGAIARKLLAQAGIEIVAWVKQVASIDTEVDPATVTHAMVEANIARCPDADAAIKMIALIDAVRKDGDSVGGVVEAVARNVPPGLGEPVFDKLTADLAKALLSLPACKGFENGSGFAGTRMRGSEHNDGFFVSADQGSPLPPATGSAGHSQAPPHAIAGRVRTRTNRSGGIQGGISNGEDIVVRAAFKPTATILKPQETVDVDGNPVTLRARGRHDPCVLPRAVPVVEAMIALVLADHLLRQRAQCR